MLGALIIVLIGALLLGLGDELTASFNFIFSLFSNYGNSGGISPEWAKYRQEAPTFLNQFSTTTPEDFCAMEVNYEDEYVTGTSTEVIQAQKNSDFADCISSASDTKNMWLDINATENTSSLK